MNWVEYAKTLGPIIVGLAGIYFAYRMNFKMFKSKQYDDERKEIYKKLNEFYGPFQQLRNKSTNLYRLFTIGKDADFRTLIALLDDEKFNDNDKKLIEEIINIDRQLEKLIIDKSGLIDDENIALLLGRASAHFTIISLAYTGVLRGEIERFKSYVFPRELDGMIEEYIKQLKQRLIAINQV